MSRRIQNEIIRRFFWYVKEMSLGDAFDATLTDAEALGELNQHYGHSKRNGVGVGN
jgi:hypothetical protein